MCPASIGESHDNRRERLTKFTVFRFAGLFCLFFLIAWGLGYPALNRYDPRHIPGLTDVKSYAALVTGATIPGPQHVRFRILVPWLARPLYRLAIGRFGSWDPVMFGLMAVDSMFVAATAMLIVVLGMGKLGSYPVALLASLLYLVNFSVPNLRLAGLVDAGEGFFLIALLWSLSDSRFWLLPFIATLGTATKESFIPFSIVFTSAWWIVERKKLDSPVTSAIWIISSWFVGLAAMIGLHWWIAGHLESPAKFAASLHGNHEYLSHFASSLWDRNFWYAFLWLLPTGIPNLRRFPKSWLVPTGAASVLAFVLDGYYGGAPGTVGRALFSVVGPVLALSSALLLLDDKHPVVAS